MDIKGKKQEKQVEVEGSKGNSRPSVVVFPPLVPRM